MPDSLSEPFVPSLHVGRSSRDFPDIELGSFHLNTAHPPSVSGADSSSEAEPAISKYNNNNNDDDDDDEGSEDEDEDDDQNRDSIQMTRARPNKHKSKSGRPVLKVKTGSDAGGEYVNGHANGSASMSSQVELRRKQPATDASRQLDALRRHDFSLDNDVVAPLSPNSPAMATTSFNKLPASDKRNFLLLCVLYFLQGIPLGLASGSVPFLLKNHLSYGQIGIFSLAIYPYSLKLLWSPIVDAVWSKQLGRRKSWILPIQLLSGASMIYLGWRIDDMMVAAGKDSGSGVWSFTGWWFALVFMCATQDIAVDGWAISLMSLPNISYASTAQTVGLTAGSFLSHTVFLALQAPDFANHWFRKTPQDVGLLTLGGYMSFWGWAYLIVTAALAVLKKEAQDSAQDSIMQVYRSMWAVLKLPNILTILAVYLVCKLGFVTNEAVTNLKLLDKGFGQANLALVVLIDFPFELGLGYYAGKWSTQYTPLRLWCWAYVARLAAAVFAQITVMVYPTPPDVAVPTWYLLIVILSHVYSTFTSTVMFVASSAFHARIADPTIGGTYMTLLATVSNLGGTFPKFFILKSVDLFTAATCIPPTSAAFDAFKQTHADAEPIQAAFSCALEADKSRCLAGGGTCQVQRDGYYITNVVFVIIGAVLFWTYIERKALALQALHLKAWRVGRQGYERVSTG